MRSQTRWIQRVVGVFTLTVALLSIPAPKSCAQASLFDSTFAVGHGANGSVNAILVQDDGKILVGGEFTQIAGQARTNLARLSSDGQLDASFPQGTEGSVYRLLQQSDGKILVAGAFTNLQGVSRRGIGRILTNGTSDLDFDAGSVLGDYDAAFSLAIQPDNKVLVGTTTASFTNSALFRLDTNGHPDPSFVQTNLFGLNYPWAIIPRTNGSILLGGGFQSVNGISLPGLALLNTNGELDLSFISPLKTNSDSSNYSGVYSIVTSIVTLPDNSFLIGGRFWKQGSTNRLTTAKLTSALTWDTTFQSDVFDPGWDYNPQIGYVMSVLRQPDGKFVLGGHFQEVGGYWRRSVVRLNADGHVDSCFDPGLGLASLQLGAVRCLALQSGGRVLVGGHFLNLMSGSDYLTRLLPQSECDTIRVHLNMKYEIAGGTCPPGGTNHLEWSTNLVNWQTAMSSTTPFVYSSLPYALCDRLFFRVRKEY